MERNRYSTHGNNAYAPQTTDSPRKVRQPQRTPQKAPQKRPSVRPITRKRVQLREAGSISFDSIFGFFTAGFLAALLINSYVNLAVTSDEIVQLRASLSALQSQNQVLSAQYEKHFDISRIEEALGETLVRPTNDQMVYIDLSQPDRVNIFGTENTNSFFAAFQRIFKKGA